MSDALNAQFPCEGAQNALYERYAHKVRNPPLLSGGQPKEKSMRKSMVIAAIAAGYAGLNGFAQAGEPKEDALKAEAVSYMEERLENGRLARIETRGEPYVISVRDDDGRIRTAIAVDVVYSVRSGNQRLRSKETVILIDGEATALVDDLESSRII